MIPYPSISLWLGGGGGHINVRFCNFGRLLLTLVLRKILTK